MDGGARFHKVGAALRRNEGAKSFMTIQLFTKRVKGERVPTTGKAARKQREILRGGRFWRSGSAKTDPPALARHNGPPHHIPYCPGRLPSI